MEKKKKKKTVIDPMVMINFGFELKDHLGNTWFIGTKNNYSTNPACLKSKKEFDDAFKAYLKEK